jgi:hypothetical protein
VLLKPGKSPRRPASAMVIEVGSVFPLVALDFG